MNVHKSFLFSLVIIVLFGLIMIASASSFQAQREFNSPFYLFFKQLGQGLLIGVLGFFFAYFIPSAVVKKNIIPLYVFAIFLLVLVFIPGFGFLYGGARRWIQIAGMSFQPSEFAKIALIFYLAGWLAGHKKELSQFWSTFLPGFCVSMIIPFLILIEPNMSNFGITSFIIFIMFFMAGAKIYHLLSAGLFIGIIAVLALFLLPTRYSRIQTLLNPKGDPQGISYQLNQSLIAIKAGGFWGRGLGMSNQKFVALPEVSGDAIFAIIAEELGFIGGFFIIVVYFSILTEGIVIIKHSKESFHQYLVVGFISLILLQAFIHIGAVSGLIPLTGVTLPFISYGGSSLISLLSASGFIAQIAKISSR